MKSHLMCAIAFLILFIFLLLFIPLFLIYEHLEELNNKQQVIEDALISNPGPNESDHLVKPNSPMENRKSVTYFRAQ